MRGWVVVVEKDDPGGGGYSKLAIWGQGGKGGPPTPVAVAQTGG